MDFKLAYLFECHFSDGSILVQTPADVSQVDPTRSAFFDVANRLQEVSWFCVYNDQKILAVDLLDGHFEMNGESFLIPVSADHSPYRLVYFRKHAYTCKMGAPLAEGDHTVEYHIGWSTILSDGTQVDRTIALI